MRCSGRSLLYSLGFFVGLLSPTGASAQVEFGYSETNLRTIESRQSGPITVRVSTLVIIHASPDAPKEQVATRPFTVIFRPPVADSPELLIATVNGQQVDMHIHGSTIDGEMEATVQVPVTAGDAPKVKMDWSTKDIGAVETTADSAVPARASLRACKAVSTSRNVCRVKNAVKLRVTA